MARVYLGWDTRLEVQRAIKVLDPTLSKSKNLRARFDTEARTMAKLHHPNVVAIQDVGNDGDRWFIVMDVVGGGSLWDRIERDGPLAPRQACETAVAILSGLQAAHDAKVIHRDLKPHNVLLTLDGTPKLTDFGIARVEDEAAPHTRTGTVMGTLAYMAPEQRIDSKRVGPAADIYAMGCTLYAMVTGEDPYDLHNPDAQADRFALLPDALVAVLQRAVKYRADERYPSAEAMSAACIEALVALPPDERVLPLVDKDRLSRTTGRPTVVSEPGEPIDGSDTTLHLETPQKAEATAYSDLTSATPTPVLGRTAVLTPPVSTVRPAVSPLPMALLLLLMGVGGVIGLSAFVWVSAEIIGAAMESTGEEPAAPTAEEIQVLPPDGPPPDVAVAPDPAAIAPTTAAAPETAIVATKPSIRPSTSAPAPVTLTPVVQTPEPTPAVPDVVPDATPEPAVVAAADLPVRVFLNTRPPSQVFINGVDKGRTPFNQKMPEGKVSVVLKEQGGTGSVEKAFDLAIGADVKFCWDYAAEGPCSR